MSNLPPYSKSFICIFLLSDLISIFDILLYEFSLILDVNSSIVSRGFILKTMLWPEAGTEIFPQSET